MERKEIDKVGYWYYLLQNSIDKKMCLRPTQMNNGKR